MYRIGLGFDVHRFSKNRKLILGGVDIPSSLGLIGHSDADVLTHALIDSILGATGNGDIGEHFPDYDKKYKNISSILLLKDIYERYIKNKYKNLEFYIVSDGAEDESVLYLIKNYGKILGVKVITPRQIKSLEKIIYVFKELVKDKEIARYVFGIPGLILLLIGLFGDLGIKIVLALSGLFLIFYGFRIDEVVKENLKDILKSKHKILTVICFIMSIMFFIFWITSCYQYLESFIKEHYVEYLIAFYHNHLELLIISLLWLLLIRKINIYVIILLLFLDVSFMLYINSISIVQYFLIVLNLFVLGFIIDKVIKIINESLYKSFAI